MQNNTYHGHCLCGSVTYQVIGEPIIVAHCHCDDCQRQSGAGHSTGAMYKLEDFTMTGETAEYKLTSDAGNTLTKVFCPKCSSPILGKNSGSKDFVTIALGTLDHSDDFNPEVVVFSENRKHWDFMDEKIHSFVGQPDWKPKKGE